VILTFPVFSLPDPILTREFFGWTSSAPSLAASCQARSRCRETRRLLEELRATTDCKACRMRKALCPKQAKLGGARVGSQPPLTKFFTNTKRCRIQSTQLVKLDMDSETLKIADMLPKRSKTRTLAAKTDEQKKEASKESSLNVLKPIPMNVK
jgi:hypothetical protein